MRRNSINSLENILKKIFNKPKIKKEIRGNRGFKSN